MRSLTARRRSVWFEVERHSLCGNCAGSDNCQVTPYHTVDGRSGCEDFYPQALVDEEQKQEHTENDEPALTADGRMWAGLAPNPAWPLSRPARE